MPARYTIDQRINVFWSNVDKSGGNDACWLWIGGCNSDGYGNFRWEGKTHSAHRIAWLLTNGSIPEGYSVLHNCPSGDNPQCVNPAHLWLGTQQENIVDRNRKNRSKTPVGEQNGMSKLTVAKVIEIRDRYAKGETDLGRLAQEYGVSPMSIHNAVRRKSWKHI